MINTLIIAGLIFALLCLAAWWKRRPRWEGVDNQPIVEIRGRELRHSTIYPQADHFIAKWED